ncbi:helix-turn-helix domain-containing protein [Gordonia amicalis]|uniref:TetR/AcrR family transcriptional regulator n=1 Tax=Gordonia amicalis TaxID=89053 RepID=UPI00295388A9|nr:helix-turn-helix domain-containing protein [Gordonia amicalis]MDV7098833.1 helix-turn-helix domain-containing protein [Gordonia amicalis]
MTRARENRALVIDTATAMFCQEGWVPTTMAAVATRAGLTRPTVYRQFANKLDLLDACIVSALRRDEGVPVRETAGYKAMGHGDRATRIGAAASWLSAAHLRSAAIQHVLDQAAVTDDAAAALRDRREQTRWAEVRWALTLILGAQPADEHVDSMWMLASRTVWLRLTGDRGWSPDRWERWFVAQTTAALGQVDVV